MKFAHAFRERLQNDGYPAEWVDAAISYRQLKKCIKKVERELERLGLDVETLGQALRSAEKERDERHAEYLLLDPDADASRAPVVFEPKLLIAVDEATGAPLDARLSPTTRDYLQQLALSKPAGPRVAQLRCLDSSSDQDSSGGASPPPDSNSSAPCRPLFRPFRMVELPLTSDSEFFGILQTELSGLAALQSRETARLSAQVTALGAIASKATEPTASKADLAAWRRVFELYVDSQIFFSTATAAGERQRDAATAQALLSRFSDELGRQGVARGFKRKESAAAFERFVRLNVEMLLSLRFQEINDLAMTKILKKFDKHTALNIKSTFPATLSRAPLSLHPVSTAKAICQQLSTSLLPLIPSLDDYLCPVCFSISWRPIRLRCNHIFCIRCLVVLQRAAQDHCPLCRGNVVMEADSANLDPALARFLQRYFPDEVRAKQRENEVAVGVDRYGESFRETRCVVM
ncbi:SPX domain-containing protein [Phyllosticta capitalensis]